MQNNGKRILWGRGKGYLNASGPQFRFILFLLTVLIVFTIILRVFQKLAEIVQLPVFLPISLITLLIFVGVVGTIYSHSFVGPLIRIRRTLEHLAEGDTSVSLRLRDSDDPVLHDLVRAIGLVCEHSRNSHYLIRDAARELSAEIDRVRDEVEKGAAGAELRQRLAVVRQKQESLEKALQSFRKG